MARISAIPLESDSPAPVPHRWVWVALLTLIGVAVHLIKITQPFVDHWDWRESDVAMIARNFYLHGYHFFLPQIDWIGSSPGYVGTEFPLVSFIAALFYKVFGVQESVGRSVAVGFFAMSVPFLFALVAKVWNDRVGLLAVGVYLVTPLTVLTGRVFMPDMPSLACSIVGMYWFLCWLERERSVGLFVGTCIALNLAIAIKLPAIIFGLPMLYLAWERYGRRMLAQPRLWGMAAFALGPSLGWYGYAKHVADHNPPHHFFGQGGIGLVDAQHYGWIFKDMVTENFGPLVFALMIAGLFVFPRKRYGWLFHWWLLAGVAFVIFAGVGNRHSWYRLPLVPASSAMCGALLDRAWRWWERLPRAASGGRGFEPVMKAGDAGMPQVESGVNVRAAEHGQDARATSGGQLAPTVSLAFLFAALAFACFHYARIPYQSWATGSMNAGKEVAAIAPPEALVIVGDGGDPQCLYYSGHKGFHFDGIIGGDPVDAPTVIRHLEALRAQGAGYLVLPQCTTMWWLDPQYYPGFSDYLDSHYVRARLTPEYAIYDIRVDRLPPESEIRSSKSETNPKSPMGKPLSP